MAVQLIQKQPRKFFVVGIHQLVHQWDACLSIQGGYFNGLNFIQNNSQIDLIEQASYV
jgi:hypothetical protein